MAIRAPDGANNVRIYLPIDETLMAKVVTQTLFNQGVIEVSSRRLPQVGKNPSTAKLPESLVLAATN